MARLEWVFLDIGGVLVDDDPLHEAMIKELREVLASSGKDMDLETVRREFVDYFLRTPGAMSRGFILTHIEDEGKALKAIDEFRRVIFPLFPRLYALRPEANGVLDALKERYKLGIIANQPASTRDFLQVTGLEARFDFIILSGEVDLTKPDPRIFQLALSKAGCGPGACVMVGDRIDADIAPSKKLGMRTVRVVNGLFAGQRARVPEEMPDAEIASIEMLPDALRTLEEKGLI